VEYDTLNPKVVAWARRSVRHVKHRAKKNGVKFTLTPECLLAKWTGRCPVFGTVLRFNEGRFGPNSPSLDRLKPKRGYTPNNVVILSYRANAIKNDANAAMLYRLAQWLEKIEWQQKGASV